MSEGRKEGRRRSKAGARRAGRLDSLRVEMTIPSLLDTVQAAPAVHAALTLGLTVREEGSRAETETRSAQDKGCQPSSTPNKDLDLCRRRTGKASPPRRQRKQRLTTCGRGCRLCSRREDRWKGVGRPGYELEQGKEASTKLRARQKAEESERARGSSRLRDRDSLSCPGSRLPETLPACGLGDNASEEDLRLLGCRVDSPDGRRPSSPPSFVEVFVLIVVRRVVVVVVGVCGGVEIVVGGSVVGWGGANLMWRKKVGRGG